MSGLETGDVDATIDHNDSSCGLLGCVPTNQSPTDSSNVISGSQGGGLGSQSDLTSGVNRPSDSDSASNFITSDNEITSGPGGVINSDQIEHFCNHHHSHARCVNHTFDIGSSISQINGNLDTDFDIPLGVKPTFDEIEDQFSIVPVDTTAADISAILLPLDSSVSILTKPNVIVSSQTSSSSSSSSSTSSSSASQSDSTHSASVVLGSFNWITFSTTKNTYSSLFSYRPCLTLYVPEVAAKILLSFNMLQRSITLCFSLPPLF